MVGLKNPLRRHPLSSPSLPFFSSPLPLKRRYTRPQESQRHHVGSLPTPDLPKWKPKHSRALALADDSISTQTDQILLPTQSTPDDSFYSEEDTTLTLDHLGSLSESGSGFVKIHGGDYFEWISADSIPNELLAGSDGDEPEQLSDDQHLNSLGLNEDDSHELHCDWTIHDFAGLEVPCLSPIFHWYDDDDEDFNQEQFEDDPLKVYQDELGTDSLFWEHILEGFASLSSFSWGDAPRNLHLSSTTPTQDQLRFAPDDRGRKYRIRKSQQPLSGDQGNFGDSVEFLSN